MKIIDLLNKIAKGEEAPKKIRFDCTYWEKVCGEKYPYYIDDCDNDLFIYFFRKNLTFTLNDEVEIIEEEKEIEKLNLDTDELKGKETVRAIDYLLEGKINELIDVINDMRDKE